MAEARQPVEASKTAWDRFINKHAFLYAAALTALVTAVVTTLITNVPKTVESVFGGDEPKISVEDDSMSLTDLSMVYADEIDRPTGGMSTDLPRGGVKASGAALIAPQNAGHADVPGMVPRHHSLPSVQSGNCGPGSG
ncbi:hypothetical protein [Micromonospora sp. 067-2]|uniref:hypothetical protein n=1 Tax=Micromonospora sp. 067-2 TaxID=2789270 RepID=UPI00397D1EDD